MKHEQVQKNISGLLVAFGHPEADITATYDEKTHTLWFALTGNTRLLFTRNAEALSALNHLATKVAEQTLADKENRLRVVIDANDFEKKKLDNLRTVAHMMAERARYFKSSIEVDPMPAHERRVIHEFLSEMPDIKTESAGEGKYRHIVIKYIGSL